MRKLTQAEVIDRFAERDLRVLERYIGSQTPILARCFKCKYERKVYPSSVFGGTRCPNCVRQVPLTQFEVIRRFNALGLELIGDYINNDLAVLVRCNRCKYKRRIKPNFSGALGCPKCARQLPLSESEVVDRFKAKKLEMLEPYKDTRTLIMVRCFTCQHERRVRPNHIFQGRGGCPRCSKVLPPTQAEATKRFSSRGLEMIEPYKNTETPILARCTKCQFKWKVTPNHVNRGQGCPCCADYGFQPVKPATLYYVKINNPFGEPVYKIGITNRTLRQRFRHEFSKIAIIETWHFERGAEAYEMEQDILSDYDADRYEGPDILDRGNDELFNFDVLGLDTGRKGQLELVA